MSMLDYHSLSI